MKEPSNTPLPHRDELHAFVDGELSATRQQEIANLVDTNALLGSQVQQIKDLKQQLKNEFSELPNTSDHSAETLAAKLMRYQSAETSSDIKDMAEHQQTHVRSTAQHRVWPAVAASLFVGLLLGALAMSRFPSPQSSSDPTTPAWVAQVVNYQEMYTEATLSEGTSVSAERRFATEQRLSRVLGAPITIPTLDELEFKRGQILQSGGQTVVQLAYSDKHSGEPFAICLTPTRGLGGIGSSKPITASSGEVNYAMWVDADIEYIAVGRYPPESLLSWVNNVKASIVNSG